jgi:hypothetical protein
MKDYYSLLKKYLKEKNYTSALSKLEDLKKKNDITSMIKMYNMYSKQDKIEELRQAIREEIQFIIKENDGGFREEVKSQYGDTLPSTTALMKLLDYHDASYKEYKEDTNGSLDVDALMDWLGY